MSYFSNNPVVGIIPFPESIVPSSVKLQQLSNTKRFESPFERYSQTQELPGVTFTLEAEFTGLTADQARLLRAFAARLRGSAGFFYFKTDYSVVPITRQVIDSDGAMSYQGFHGRPRTLGNQTPGPILKTIGWMADRGDLLMSAGEYISYDDYKGFRHSHILTEDAYMPESAYDQDSVIVELRVAPMVGEQPPMDSDIMSDAPSALFKLVDDSQLGITQMPGGEYRARLSAVGTANPGGGAGGDGTGGGAGNKPPLYALPGRFIVDAGTSEGGLRPGCEPFDTLLTITARGDVAVPNLSLTPGTGMTIVSTTCPIGGTLELGESCTAIVRTLADCETGWHDYRILLPGEWHHFRTKSLGDFGRNFFWKSGPEWHDWMDNGVVPTGPDYFTRERSYATISDPLVNYGSAFPSYSPGPNNMFARAALCIKAGGGPHYLDSVIPVIRPHLYTTQPETPDPRLVTTGIRVTVFRYDAGGTPSEVHTAANAGVMFRYKYNGWNGGSQTFQGAHAISGVAVGVGSGVGADINSARLELPLPIAAYTDVEGPYYGDTHLDGDYWLKEGPSFGYVNAGVSSTPRELTDIFVHISIDTFTAPFDVDLYFSGADGSSQLWTVMVMSAG